jgi:hypothetical protein
MSGVYPKLFADVLRQGSPESDHPATRPLIEGEWFSQITDMAMADYSPVGAIVKTAARICGAGTAAVMRLHDGQYHLASASRGDQGVAGQAVDVKRVGRELGVRYVLKGLFAKPPVGSAFAAGTEAVRRSGALAVEQFSDFAEMSAAIGDWDASELWSEFAHTAAKILERSASPELN